jgi:hypothetical protein
MFLFELLNTLQEPFKTIPLHLEFHENLKICLTLSEQNRLNVLSEQSAERNIWNQKGLNKKGLRNAA